MGGEHGIAVLSCELSNLPDVLVHQFLRVGLPLSAVFTSPVASKLVPLINGPGAPRQHGAVPSTPPRTF